MPLLIAPIGRVLIVRRVGGEEKVRKHLESLGIVIDSEITLLSQGKDGVVVKIHDSRLALDYDVAKAIMVG